MRNLIRSFESVVRRFKTTSYLLPPIHWRQKRPGFSLVELLVVIAVIDRKSTRLNSSHSQISYAVFIFFNDTATTEISPLSLHDALPILPTTSYPLAAKAPRLFSGRAFGCNCGNRSEEHTSELQSQSNLVCRFYFF